MYGQTSLARGKVRVTKRLYSPHAPKPGTAVRLLAREGEEMSVAEARRRGIAEKYLEPVGPAGKVALAAYNKTKGDAAAKAAAAEKAAREELRGTTPPPGGGTADPPEEFPYHAGGGWFVLSNGEKVQGKDDAVKAEAKLKNGG